MRLLIASADVTQRKEYLYRGANAVDGSKLYVGNLKYAATEDELRTLFSEYGTVEEVTIIEGKGFGFVKFAETEEAEKAKEELSGKEFLGRMLKIDEARPPKKFRDRGPRRY